MPTTLYSNLLLDSLKENISGIDGPLICDSNKRQISGTEILTSIDRIALDLIDAGVNRNDRVIFLARPSIESILYFFALLRSGAVVVLVDPEMGQDNFRSRIEFSKAQYILQDRILEKIEKYPFVKPLLRSLHIWFPDNLPIPAKNRITLKKLKSILSANSPLNVEESRVDADNDMVIIFTSGTVAQPKGVVHTYRSLFQALQVISSEIAISKTDNLYASQFYFLLLGLMVSARTYIPKSKPFDAKTFLKVASANKLTSAFLLPFEGELVYKQCTKNNSRLPASFKTLLFGSAPVTKGFLTRFSKICDPSLNIYGVYGSTEMLPISLIEARVKINYPGRGDLLGKPAPGVEVKISDDKEFLVSGPQLYDRYLGADQKAEQFASGDLGEIDEQGNLILLGRKKDMIIRKGINVYPTLFESSISKIPGVIECSLVGVYDEQTEDERIILFVVPEADDPDFLPGLKKALETGKHSIDRYALPDEIRLIPTMPTSGRSKKVDKKILQSMAVQA